MFEKSLIASLWVHFGEEPFEREVVAATDPFSASYEAMLKIDVRRARASFLDMFDEAKH